MPDSVLTVPDPRLKKPSDPAEFTPEALARARALFGLMRASGGIGLAAPQVGWHSRLFVMDVSRPILVANPRILRASVSTAEDWEGCLSVPGVAVLVRRPSSVKVEAEVATEEDLAAGRVPSKTTLDLGGLDARCFQHESDHLSGTLIIDRGTRTRPIILPRQG